MSEVWELPTANLTILTVACAVCAILSIVCYFAYIKDKWELRNIGKVVYFQDKISPNDPIYILTLTIVDRFVTTGRTDIILRFRGSKKNGPLLLYRDEDGSIIANGTTLNIGFTVPFDLGPLVGVDVAADNSELEEGKRVLSFSNLYIRKLLRKAPTTASTNEVASKGLRTWVSLETLTGCKGVGILGIPHGEVPREGTGRVARARDSAINLTLQEELPNKKKIAKTGFRPLHYIWSQNESWHDEWSEYSYLNQELTICLDLIATLVVVACCYAFGVEELLGAGEIASVMQPSADNVGAVAMSVDELDLSDLSSNWAKYSVPLAVVSYMALITCIFVVPLSLMWSRLFGAIGGKGFKKTLQDTQPPLKSNKPMSLESKATSVTEVPPSSARIQEEQSDVEDEIVDNTLIVLRTLEVKNTFTGMRFIVYI